MGAEYKESNFSCLSDRVIVDYLQKGRIVIEPFNEENLSTSSYDVSLGEFFYREQPPAPGHTIYSPWSMSEVNRIWSKANCAETAELAFSQIESQIPAGIKNEDKVILIRPGETILAHTEEFIGGRDGITTMMKARSSMGRNFIEVCKCAGWGDVGYINRWTMEITNNSEHYTIPLVVGRRIAQIVFFEVGPTFANYDDNGKYQESKDINEVKRTWSPHDMLPKMWKDREVGGM